MADELISAAEKRIQVNPQIIATAKEKLIKYINDPNETIPLSKEVRLITGLETGLSNADSDTLNAWLGTKGFKLHQTREPCVNAGGYGGDSYATYDYVIHVTYA